MNSDVFRIQSASKSDTAKPHTPVADEYEYTHGEVSLWPDFQNGKAWSFTFENDIFVGDDDGLTNVIGIQLAHGAFDRFSNQNLPNWLYWLVGDSYINREENRKRGVVYVLGQAIQTPKDISTNEPIIDDLPYAGLLISSATLYFCRPKDLRQAELFGRGSRPIFLRRRITISYTLIDRIGYSKRVG